MNDHAPAVDRPRVGMTAGADFFDELLAKGRYSVECTDADGNVLWRDEIENVVATVGKNLALDTVLAGAAYTVTGPFLGLITSTSFSAVSAADTMASHAGWLEGGGTNAPAYTGTRPTAAFSAASAGSKAMSAAASFVFTSGGTVQGLFMAYGTGAVTTKDNTAGTLLSAGTLAAAQPVITGNTINATWTLGL